MENEQSKRSTPNIVGFAEHSRVFGYDAYREQSKRPENVLAYAKTFLGVPYNDTKAHRAFEKTFQSIEISGEENSLRAKLRVKDQELFPEEPIGMLLEYVKKLAEAQSESSVKDCVITIPSFFTRAQRIAIHNAAKLAKLNVLALMHENTAAALYYGIDRLDNETDHYALFYNLGASHLQVSVAKYSVAERKVMGVKRQLESIEMLSHVENPFVGGVMFDSLITEYLLEEFQRQKGQSLQDSAKAKVKLFQAANSAKKTLSASKFTPIQINNIHKGIDFSTSITRENFEEMLSPHLAALVVPVHKAISEAGLSLSQINNFEIVGGVSRVPKVQEYLKQELGVELAVHLNGDEAMAHGSALYAANFSSTVQIKPIWLTDISNFGVQVKFYGAEFYQESELFGKESALGTLKKINFTCGEDLKVVVEGVYSEELQELLEYQVTGIKELKDTYLKDPEVKVTFALDRSGIPFLKNAEAQLEVEVTEVVTKKVPKEPSKQETEEETLSEEETVPEEETAAEETVPEEETLSEEITKLETKKFLLNTTSTQLEKPFPLNATEIKQIRDDFKARRDQEEEIKRLVQVKNDIESYIYYMKEKIEDEEFLKVTQEQERSEFMEELVKAQDWMETEEFDKLKSWEIRKAKRDLENKFVDAMDRLNELQIRDQVVKESLAGLKKLETKLEAIKESKPWINEEELESASTKIQEAKDWIQEKVEEQSLKELWEAPAFRSKEVELKIPPIERELDRLKRKQKPKEKKKEPETKDTQEESQEPQEPQEESQEPQEKLQEPQKDKDDL